MRVIYAANKIDKIFGQPSFVGPREGVGNVEEYPDAEVIFPADDPLAVQFVAKSERGQRALNQALVQVIDFGFPIIAQDDDNHRREIAELAAAWNAGEIEKYEFYAKSMDYSAELVAAVADIPLHVVEDRRRYLKEGK